MPADPATAEALLAAGAPVEALVPADIGGLRAAAEVLRWSADVLETGGAALSRIEVTHWRGETSMAFSDRISVEPGRWQSASDALAAGASALDRYADDVGAARSTAAQAEEIYQEYCSAVTEVAVAGGVTGPLVGGPMSVGMRVGELQSTPDTAAANAVDALRRRALELLERARAAVAGAGDLAAAAMAAASDGAPEARRLWESGVRPAAVIDAGHTTLDAVGLVPVVGDPADAVNALWYVREGDYTNGGMSAVGLVPIVGEYVILQKFGRRILVRDGLVQGGRAGADILGRDTLRSLGDGGLLAHELGEDFHTIARHVGRTDEQLAERLLAEPHLLRASTFTTLADAERYTYANLGGHGAEIDAFLSSADRFLPLRLTFDHPIGKTMLRHWASAVDASGNVTMLRKDSSMPNGYRIVTSFPEP